MHIPRGGAAEGGGRGRLGRFLAVAALVERVVRRLGGDCGAGVRGEGGRGGRGARREGFRVEFGHGVVADLAAGLVLLGTESCVSSREYGRGEVKGRSGVGRGSSYTGGCLGRSARHVGTELARLIGVCLGVAGGAHGV